MSISKLSVLLKLGSFKILRRLKRPTARGVGVVVFSLHNVEKGRVCGLVVAMLERL